MKRLTQTSIFKMVKSTQKEAFTCIELDAAMDEFITYLIKLSDAESDYISLFRTLHYTKHHLNSLLKENIPCCEVKKKCSDINTNYRN